MFPFIAEFSPCLFSVELPLDLGAVAVGVAIPGADSLVEGLQVWNTPCAQALSLKHTDLYSGLVKPASMPGRIVNGEPVPDFAASFWAKQVGQRLAAVNVQIVHRGFR